MPIKKMTTFALFCAVALVLGFLESMIPLLSVMPGGKIGLANTVTLLVFYLYSFPEALLFGLLRSLLASVLYSGFAAFVYSATGTLLSLLVMWIVKTCFKTRVTAVGVSVAGAAFFNVGQLSVAAMVLENAQIFRYFPAMGVISAFAGLLTGYVVRTMMMYMNRKNCKL